MSWYDDWKKRVLNRPLAGVDLSPDRESLTIRFQDGGSQRFTVSGDCCSTSWIEHLTVPNDIVGARILTIGEDGEQVDHADHECLQVYQTHFRTDRGDVTLEFRNSSNGYYGGSLDDAGHEDPAVSP